MNPPPSRSPTRRPGSPFKGINRSGYKKVPIHIARGLAFLCAALGAVVLIQCAGQISPGGGPIDTVPPTIVKTVPDTNSVRVQTGSVDLEFSKYVDRRSVEESIFISPNVGVLEFDWSGTGVTVMFSQPLRKNTTYVVSVGTDVVDLRARNRMAAGFTLAFSTGDSIDKGFISGRVFDEKPEGVMIFAYTLQNVNSDTLDPSRLKPDYVTQTGKEGTFTLSNVALETYRLFAIRDEYRNFLYDKEVDQYGVANADIPLTPQQQRFEGVWFRMSQEDTTKPFLTNARATDARHILIRFSEPMDSLSFQNGAVSVGDTLTGKDISIQVSHLDRLTPSAAGLVTRATLDSSTAYRVHVADVFDRAGNSIDTMHASYVFLGVNRPDTAKPVITIRSLKDSTRGISLDQPFDIHFSEPVEQAPLDRAMMISDAARKPVETAIRWVDAIDARLLPKKPLKDNAWHEVRVVMDSVRDLVGNRYKDSTLVLHFQTLDFRTTGTVEGSVEDLRKDARKGVIRVTATRIDTQPPTTKTVELPGPGKFEIDHIPEGRYVVSGFIDADSSGSYTYGRPYPIRPSERFTIYPDTIQVRARWGVEGIIVTFR